MDKNTHAAIQVYQNNRAGCIHLLESWRCIKLKICPSCHLTYAQIILFHCRKICF